MSLDNDMKHYRIENNRRYHTYRTLGERACKLNQNGLLMESGDGAYWIPHDDEALRLDLYA